MPLHDMAGWNIIRAACLKQSMLNASSAADAAASYR
jgi:hypothetical protein